MKNLRLLNVIAAVIVTLLGFVFDELYHDGHMLITGLICSFVLTSNYLLSFYNSFYRKNFTSISFISVFIIHFWEVYVTYVRNFDINFLLPVSISVFSFSLIFNSFYKCLAFIFTITTSLLILMLATNHWEPHYTVTIVALYAGAFLTGDIMKRKSEFHTEIQNQEKRYLALVENMNDGLIYISNDIITFINEKFTHITGFTADELIGKPYTNIFSNIHLDSFSISNPDSTQELIIRNKSGTTIWLRIIASPVYSGQSSDGIMLVCTDISKLKNTEEELKKREEGYRTFIDQSAVGIWRAEYIMPVPTSLPVEEQIDLLLDTGIISECNDFMAEMYGYSSSVELIGRRIRDFYYIENNFDDEKTRELLRAFITNNYRISNAESKELDKNGVIRYMLNNNIGIIENGVLIRTWGVQTDITDRKKTERELIESNQELDTFFYKASHDLKGPLASVMGIVNLARLENGGVLSDSRAGDEPMEKYFGMIETSVKRLDRTLLDLIELARTRKGSSKLTLVNIKSTIDEILHSLRHVPGYSKINFEVKVDHHIELMVDKVLLLSVLQNLIHNAINYCNHDSPWVRIAVTRNNSGSEIEIADNGKGIPEAIRNRVFEMFYRGNTESTGSGLGLFIVKNALEKMKGTINLKSRDGQGTIFTVQIPDAAIEVYKS
jgi:PAS domain S-box-containing protein